MKQVLILCGGKSDEHEVSLISAKCVLDALDRKQFEPILIGISKKGVWHLERETNFYTGELRADRISLNENAPTVTLSPFSNDYGQGSLVCKGQSISFDVAFPILHGRWGEDGTIQGLFEILGVPYVGAATGASWICIDKLLTKTLCAKAGIRVADFVWVSSVEELEDKKTEIARLGDILFVKPPTQGSSVGITKVTSPDLLAEAVRTALRYDKKALIEKAIVGREIECAVLGLHGSARVAAPGEVIPSKQIGWYSYEAKYLLPDGADTVVPADLDERTAKQAQDFALKVFNLVECDGMARIDLFLEAATDEFYLNEVNTIPGFTPISMYPKMWQASGVSYTELISELLHLAFKRMGRG